ncbi:diacylglycerol kinase family protein [Paenibacillus sp. J5C_2022]|uniref:diacylglycerol kinase family protein n=1 Tax=Paenibacillus sp. J5C2022 TaxID=2977129 RepID=UPI0021D05538|nr:diacylglycerol kinase family protein [Paenibacillus sp. J5C2022]MCU6707679.1 diacylglycerol kinase family protein [Paenibacillus sp. J5C2022]
MKALIRSVGLALSGIRHSIATQRHMQIHCIAAFLVFIAGMMLSLNALEWALIAMAVGMVISAEVMNTAVENAVDLACPERHPLAKIAKDCAAGAVLICAIAAVIIGLLVMGPPLWQLLTGS